MPRKHKSHPVVPVVRSPFGPSCAWIERVGAFVKVNGRFVSLGVADDPKVNARYSKVRKVLAVGA